jgi:hypothetical protein
VVTVGSDVPGGGCTVGVSAGTGVAVSVVGVGVAVSVGSKVAVVSSVGAVVARGVPVGGCVLGVSVTEITGDGVGTAVGVIVRVTAGVEVISGVGITVGVRTGVSVRVGVGVIVGVVRVVRVIISSPVVSPDSTIQPKGEAITAKPEVVSLIVRLTLTEKPTQVLPPGDNSARVQRRPVVVSGAVPTKAPPLS